MDVGQDRRIIQDEKGQENDKGQEDDEGQMMMHEDADLKDSISLEFTMKLQVSIARKHGLRATSKPGALPVAFLQYIRNM